MNPPIIWSRPAQHDLRRLAPDVAARIVAAVERLAQTGQGDVRPLSGQGGLRRLRVGDWRVVFSYDGETGALLVARAQPRDRAYRG